ncbi:cellulose synthase [Kaistia nematophila]|uniref:cellulose synthase n=1 Tax=Kaistia nematophila TaxID=2994654 RepID=UPI0022561F16|nr:cellulose synthase [Kaistia nematophila]
MKQQLLILGAFVVIGLEGAYLLDQALSPAEAGDETAQMLQVRRVQDAATDFYGSSASVPVVPTRTVRMAQAPAAPAAPAVAPAAPAPAIAPAPALAAAPAVDETALRYFARQGDQRRLQAEIARLRALNPDWTPPDDFSAPVPISDPVLDQMWKLYGDGQYAAVRSAIAARLAREPNWQVPPDLLARLEVGEARDRLVNASNAQQWNTVVSVAAATPALLTCADVDVLWRVAEGFAKTARTPRARDVGVYILTNCQDPKERLATVQKAMGYLDDAELNELLKLERTGPDGQGEFAPVKGDLARRRLAAGAKDPSLAVAPDDIALVERLVREGTGPDDAVLLGSYWFQHNDPTRAAQWFELAKGRADTAEIARGYAYVLNALKRPVDAETAAYKWRDATKENTDAYLVVATATLAIDPPVKLERDVLTRMATAISDAKYGPGAQEFGWYAYKIGQTAIAARWFATALSLMPNDEPSAYGLALANQKLKDKAGFEKIIREWGPRSPRIAALADPKAARQRIPAAEAIPGPDGAVAVDDPAPAARVETVADEEEADPAPVARPARRQQAAAQPAERRAAPRNASRSRGRTCTGEVRPALLSSMSALNRGWCLMDLNRPIEAADAFDVALRTSYGQVAQDAAYGKTLAYLRAGLTDQAAASAAQTSQTVQRAIELKTEILTQRAIGSYNDGRYIETLLMLDERSRIAPEQNDLMMMRGWSYFHLRRWNDAKTIFVAVAGTGSREAQRALATLAEAMKPH